MSTIIQSPTLQAGDKLLLDTREAARRLSISERTLWAMTQAGDLPHVRIGRRVLYRPASLDAYLASIERTGAAAQTEATP